MKLSQFIYQENIELLEKMGCIIKYFSPIHDKAVPPADGLILYGGYPELYAAELSANIPMLTSIRKCICEGMPTIAECGGFMYLMEQIHNKDGIDYPMAGFFKGKAFWTGKLVRFGYVIITSDELEIKGHEFHYFDTDNNGDDCMAKKPTGNRSFSCIHKEGMSHMGFTHLYYLSSPAFIKNFVEAMEKYGRN